MGTVKKIGVAAILLAGMAVYSLGDEPGGIASSDMAIAHTAGWSNIGIAVLVAALVVVAGSVAFAAWVFSWGPEEALSVALDDYRKGGAA